jgi:undecaprenyl pyrophosphate phosphatase UppP
MDTQHIMTNKTKLWIHIGLAAIPTIVLGLQDYKTLSDISSIKWIMLILNCLVQALNACKAFTDTSSGREAVQKEEVNKQEREDIKNLTSSISLSA